MCAIKFAQEKILASISLAQRRESAIECGRLVVLYHEIDQRHESFFDLTWQNIKGGQSKLHCLCRFKTKQDVRCAHLRFLFVTQPRQQIVAFHTVHDRIMRDASPNVVKQ